MVSSYLHHVRMRPTVRPYVPNAPSTDQISVCIFIPHLIYIKMQIPIHKHLLTRKPYNRHYRQPPAKRRQPCDWSEILRSLPTQPCAAAAQLSGASVNRAIVWNAFPRGFASGSHRVAATRWRSDSFGISV